MAKDLVLSPGMRIVLSAADAGTLTLLSGQAVMVDAADVYELVVGSGQAAAANGDVEVFALTNARVSVAP